MKLLPCFCLFTLLFLSCQNTQKTPDAGSEAISGDWYGLLNADGQELRIVFHVSKKDENYSSTMDSPDQGAEGIPTTATTFKENNLTVSIENMQLKYEGKLSEDGSKVEGTFQQGAGSFPLVLTKEKMEKVVKTRPQDPKDFPYMQEEVKFANPKGGHQLAGTLTKPNDDKFDKVVVLISGSGPQNRNEEIESFNHRPFLVLSDYLTRNGIAVLRYDDRGTGESGGDFATATSKDLAADAAAAVSFLQSRADMKGKLIGLAGHSEGGMIAPMIAAENKQINFIVLLAGPGISIDKLMLLQSDRISEASKVPENVRKLNKEILAEVYQFIKSNPTLGSKDLEKELKTFFEKKIAGFPADILKEIGDKDKFIEQQIKGVTGDWFLYFIRFEPSDYLNKVTCPVLAVNGSLDLQVTDPENLAGIEASLKKGGNKNFVIKSFKGLNHLFQTAKTGAPSEYPKIEETFNEEALKFVGDWINKVAK